MMFITLNISYSVEPIYLSRIILFAQLSFEQFSQPHRMSTEVSLTFSYYHHDRISQFFHTCRGIFAGDENTSKLTIFSIYF